MRYYMNPERKLITEKQVGFIRRLAQERGTEFLSDGTDIHDDQQIFALPRDVASAQIDALLATPNRSAEKFSAPLERVDENTLRATSKPIDGLDLTTLRGGYYAATIDGVTKFFKVDRVEDGRWEGWTFVKIQASDELHRQGSQKPGQAYRGSSQDFLRAILADENAAYALYGTELGRCGVCGRTLTDETSRELGIGPICRERVGI